MYSVLLTATFLSATVEPENVGARRAKAGCTGLNAQSQQFALVQVPQMLAIPVTRAYAGCNGGVAASSFVAPRSNGCNGGYARYTPVRNAVARHDARVEGRVQARATRNAVRNSNYNYTYSPVVAVAAYPPQQPATVSKKVPPVMPPKQ